MSDDDSVSQEHFKTFVDINAKGAEVWMLRRSVNN